MCWRRRKIVLGHCYTTENKGDAGIVLATVSEINAVAPDVELIGISTFASSDGAFQVHHADYRSAGVRMVPALLPEDKIFKNGKVFTSTAAKAASFSLNLLSLAWTLLVYKKWPGLAPEELTQTLDALAGADVFISKGGSFICNDSGGIRGDISLFKLLVPFAIAKRLGVRTVVLGQSLGPFTTRSSRVLFRLFSRYIDRIYLRERVGLKYLTFMGPNFARQKLDDCPDVAFALEAELFKPVIEIGDRPAIGLTIVNHRFADESARETYVDIICRAVDFFAKRIEGAKFYIFPQVLSPHVDGSVDIELSKIVAARCRRQYGVTPEVLEGDYDARALKETYRRMRFFIATRLHSSIFAVSAGVPTVVFGYHGSKAEGVWRGLGFERFFFDINSVKWPLVERALAELLQNEKEIALEIAAQARRNRRRIREVVQNEIG